MHLDLETRAELDTLAKAVIKIFTPDFSVCSEKAVITLTSKKAFHCENSSKTHAQNIVFTAKANYIYLKQYPYCESSCTTHAKNGVLTQF